MNKNKQELIFAIFDFCRGYNELLDKDYDAKTLFNTMFIKCLHHSSLKSLNDLKKYAGELYEEEAREALWRRLNIGQKKNS